MSLSDSDHSAVDLPKVKESGETKEEESEGVETKDDQSGGEEKPKDTSYDVSPSKTDDTFSSISPFGNRRPSKLRRRVTSVKKVLKKTENEQYHDECKHGCFGRIFFNVLWLTVLAVMIFYTFQIATQYIISSANPSNTVTYTQQDELPLPQVVVCNWNADSNLTDGNSSCPSCQLDIVACSNINTSADCTSGWKREYVKTIGGAFHCYTFNDDPNNVTRSITVSYAGSYSTVFKVQIANTTQTPNPSSIRGGLQVTFGVPGTITPDDIYREYRFAQIGTDTFYAISAINTIRGDISPSDPNYNTTEYQTSSSSVTLLNSYQPNIQNANTGYISVSFSFESLNLEVITYGFAYSLENFFGDFAGMIGTLMGLDMIKIMAAIPVGWASIKMRSCIPLEDLFNG